MSKKTKIRKRAKPGIQDFISKIKELRRLDDPVIMKTFVESDNFQYPSSFKWRGMDYQVEKVIGRWKIQSMDDPYIQNTDQIEVETETVKNGFRVQLMNGFQVDLVNEIDNSKWKIIGIEHEFFDLLQNSQ